MKLLVVCTANICRSPMAERFLRQAANERGVGEAVTVTSAGLLEGGRSASEGSTRAMQAYGISLADHRSRRLTPELITGADLVVAMTVRHVQESAVMAPARFGSIFTLRELVRRSAAAGPRGDRPLTEWLAAVGRDRSTAALIAAHDLDVEDPYGGPPEGYVSTAKVLDDLTRRLADSLWGPA